MFNYLIFQVVKHFNFLLPLFYILPLDCQDYNCSSCGLNMSKIIYG